MNEGRTEYLNSVAAVKDCILGVKELNEESIDLVLTDPPYNIGGHMKTRGSGIHRLRENHFSVCEWDNIDEELWQKHMSELASCLFEKVKFGGAVIVFMAVIKVETVKKLFEEAGFYYKTIGVWHKTNPMPRNMNLSFVNSTETWLYFTKVKPSGTFNNEGKMYHDFIETGLTPKSEKKHGKHPTQKPLKLMEHFVQLLSNENETVLDPFCGSGSSLVAAKLHNRNYIGFDINNDYIEVAIKRLEEV